MSEGMSKAEETLHNTALRRQDKLNRLASVRLRVVNGKVEKYKAAPPVQDFEAVLAEATAAKKRAYREAVAAAKPGDMIEGHGVLIGTWQLKDSEGNSLSEKFNVFAAPEDLQQDGKRSCLNYKDTLKLLAATKDWHDHDGAAYENDKEFYQAVKDGRYNGEWIIPPRELLSGTEADAPLGIRQGKVVQPDSLFAHRNAGALKDTFMTEYRYTYTDHPDLYFTSTEKDGKDYIRCVRILDSNDGWLKKSGKSSIGLSCRPIRMEPV